MREFSIPTRSKPCRAGLFYSRSVDILGHSHLSSGDSRFPSLGGGFSLDSRNAYNEGGDGGRGRNTCRTTGGGRGATARARQQGKCGCKLSWRTPWFTDYRRVITVSVKPPVSSGYANRRKRRRSYSMIVVTGTPPCTWRLLTQSPEVACWD